MNFDGEKMDEKLDMKAIASVLEKFHVMVWVNYEEEDEDTDTDDTGIVIVHRKDAQRLWDTISKHKPKTFAKLISVLKKSKIPNITKTWDDADDDEDEGFGVFEYPFDYEEDDEDEDEDDDDDEDDEIEYDDSDIKQKYLITMDDCTPCVTRKKKYSKEIKSGKIIVVNEKTGKGKTIAKALDIDAFPVLVAELTPSAVKKNKLKSPYISLDD